MRNVHLTVLIEDSDDIDMNVRVVAPASPHAAPVVPFKSQIVATRHDASDDEYTLGGYAGI
ncbi:hypothetical protein HBF26_16165 [Luteibacter jiangsuensis]|uniref:Uncharacterized protein n=1 Tax=Luteibacter jiangsuensis TaxID=637577 RepID=A0ABX0Q7U9_9GAMM|nr:hypothetical protein [Luteibacter jiangsuensis]NID06431.1 hypothetical protein [Luteibacter jiangsuensis]